MRYNDLVDDYLNKTTAHTKGSRTVAMMTKKEVRHKKKSSPKLHDASNRPKAGGVPKIMEFNGRPEDCP